MKKEEIYNQYARIIEEDGTWSDLKKIYLSHPQQDVEILKKACQEMTEYVRFCLEIVESYWSESQQSYIQIGDDLDESNYQIELSYDELTITKDTDLSTIEYPNIKGLMKMNQLNLRYTPLFNHLLDGNFYLDKTEL